MESRPCSSLSGNQQAADAISTHSTSSFERGDIPDCGEERSGGSGPHASLSLDVTSGESTTRRKQGRTNQVHPDPKTRSNIDYKVALVWLESMEDYLTFPVNELGNFSLTIFVHPLSTGLLRIKLAGSFGKISVSSPLVDGMVVSRRSVGPLLRQTAINMCRRRRLEQNTDVRARILCKPILEYFLLTVKNLIVLFETFCTQRRNLSILVFKFSVNLF